jgi:signal transduction histidine kinase
MADESSERLETLKADLADLASNPDGTDYDAILKLSSEIAALDPDHVRFSTDAAMVRRLGRELVAKQETALAELVKNAYDADATTCLVRLVTDFTNLSLVIEDNGSGMDRDQLVNGFMRLASDSKVQNPVSPRYGRKRAGKKGIGRFASERLGRHLRVITQTDGADFALGLSVDWDRFVQGEDLSHVKNSIEVLPAQKSVGTRLQIDGLSDSWSDAELRRVFRYVLTLQQPFGLDQLAKDTGSDPGFVVTFERENTLIDLAYDVATAESEILQLALATIDAEIDDQGQTTWSLSAPRIGLFIKNEAIGLERGTDPLPNARNVKVRAYYYIYIRELLGRSTSAIQDFMRVNGGVKLYRNGYRVPPYGEQDDDWLGLDEASSRRTVLSPVANRNFIGAVAIDDPAGRLFEETSARERLLENEAFREMRSIVSSVLITASLRIDAHRTDSKKLVREERAQRRSEQATNAANRARAALEKISAAAHVGSTPDAKSIAEAKEAIDDAISLGLDIAEERDALLAELNLLRILASMGLTVAEFTHDFSALAQTIELNLEELIPHAASDAAPVIERLRRQFGLIQAYTGYFGAMMTSNASRKLEPVDLYKVALDFADSVSAMLERRSYKLTVERPADYDIFTVPMHASEWSAILLNLMTNSIKAATRAQRSAEFLIRVGFDGPNTVWLDFSDNGDGIPEENRTKIFEPFFTTSPAAEARASDAAHALGTGLGLKIVADTVDSVDGVVKVIDPPTGYATCIRVSVPAGPPPEFET